MSVKISVIMSTRNDGHNIENCLKCVQWADEIILMDLSSTDNTVEIAKTCNARIIMNDYVASGELVTQLLINEARNEWILSLCADEFIPQSLRNELFDIAEKNAADIVWLPRKNFFWGQEMQGGGVGPLQDIQMRFFKKQYVEWPLRVHSSPNISPEARQARIANPELAMIHHTYDDVENWIERINRFSTAQAEYDYSQGEKNDLNKTVNKFFDSISKQHLINAFQADGEIGVLFRLIGSMHELMAGLKLKLMVDYKDVKPRAKIREKYQEAGMKLIKQYEGDLSPVADSKFCDQSIYLESDNLPQVSICMSIFNCGERLDKVIQSLLEQTFSDFELIIVDNGSSDGSAEIYNRYAEMDHRIKIYKIETNVGSARGSGDAVSYAKGKYIMLSSGNYRWHKRFIENAFFQMEMNHQAVKCSGSGVDEITGIVAIPPNTVGMTITEKVQMFLSENSNVGIWGLYRADVLKGRKKLYEPIFAHDIRFLFSLLFIGDFVHITDEVYIFANVHSRPRGPVDDMNNICPQALLPSAPYTEMIQDFAEQIPCSSCDMATKQVLFSQVINTIIDRNPSLLNCILRENIRSIVAMLLTQPNFNQIVDQTIKNKLSNNNR